jgi:hypothetical protein
MLVMTFRKILLTVFLLFSINTSFSQNYNSVNGKILDSITKQPLAFVNIMINDQKIGGMTDIDGKFFLRSPEKIHQLKITYLGYSSKNYQISSKTKDLTIYLLKSNIELSEVIIFPGENPAHRIIRKVIENKSKNDPENIKTFKYDSYSKLTAEYLPNEKFFSDSSANFSRRKDSTYIKIKEISEKQHAMLIESFSKRIYMHPDKSYEKVVGTRVSGFQNPNFSSLATDIQPFSFYQDFFRLSIAGEKDYINPLSTGSFNRYKFVIEDTLYQGVDSVFVISFEPKERKKFNALKGVMYINTNGYAIQNVMAEPEEQGLWIIRIQQKYEFLENSQWFPSQLNYDWILPKYPTEKIGLVLRGRSYISNVQLNAKLKNSDFPLERVKLSDSAGIRDENFWVKHRSDTLNAKEITTYRVIDKLGKRYKFDYMQRAASELMDGFIPLGPINISLTDLFSYNDVEGARLGFGIRTNDKITRWVYLGGYFGYGFKDKTLKYGGDLQLNFNRTRDLYLKASYSYDYESPGNTDFYQMGFSNYWFGYMQSRFDAVEKKEVLFGFRPFKYTDMYLSFSNNFVKPLYNYGFVYNTDNGHIISDFTFTEATLGLKFAYKERLKNAFGRRLAFASGEYQYPVFYLTYTHGFNQLLGGQFDYDRLEASIEKNFRIKGLGTSTISVEGGYIWQDIPYSRLYNGKGSNNKTFQVVMNGTFQAMGVNEFLSDKFVYVFFTHNFERLLFEAKRFKPEVRLVNNIAFGTLKNPERQKDIEFKTLESGYYEGGLIIDNILRVNILNLFYFGVGVGAFYRYGYYSYEKPIDNAAFKASLKITWN